MLPPLYSLRHAMACKTNALKAWRGKRPLWFKSKVSAWWLREHQAYAT